MNFNELKQSKKFQRTIALVLGVIVAILIFKAGVFVGYRKATFSHHLGDNYAAMFGGPNNRGNMMGGPNGFFRDDFTSGHGAVGEIIRIELPNVVIEDRDNVEKNIILTTDTKIKQFRDSLKPTDLKVDDKIVVIGDPNDQGQITAKLVRLLPNDSQPSATTTTPLTK